MCFAPNRTYADKTFFERFIRCMLQDRIVALSIKHSLYGSPNCLTLIFPSWPMLLNLPTNDCDLLLFVLVIFLPWIIILCKQLSIHELLLSARIDYLPDYENNSFAMKSGKTPVHRIWRIVVARYEKCSVFCAIFPFLQPDDLRTDK